ncbi:hypothetical protein RJ639_024821 [Escallonia herrerae]|uniref:DUF985 domain-containing protein n=1 Tax=Escallonia herrerae TaxID=1293975 RepID=A0AA88UX32_9ASTE|nr:hypothetical protein RJ639_024821 [Escallonia herrerae]
MATITPSKSEVVSKLNLKPHPEGGFYSETARDSSIILTKSLLPPESLATFFFPVWVVLDASVEVSDLDKVDRPISTCIYFLLSSGSVSHLHRIPCSETWHFYIGEPLTVLELNDKDGSVKLTCLGSNIMGGSELLQHTVPPYVWFGAYPTKDITINGTAAVNNSPRDAENHYSLVGCTCAPAFQYEDFELANRSELISRFPGHESLITLLTFPN